MRKAITSSMWERSTVQQEQLWVEEANRWLEAWLLTRISNGEWGCMRKCRQEGGGSCLFQWSQLCLRKKRQGRLLNRSWLLWRHSGAKTNQGVFWLRWEALTFSEQMMKNPILRKTSWRHRSSSANENQIMVKESYSTRVCCSLFFCWWKENMKSRKTQLWRRCGKKSLWVKIPSLSGS